MPEVDFYRTAAIVSCTLLGLWWVVVRGGLADRPGGERLSLDTSLYFVITGMMSLLALSAPSSTALWRSAFGVASVLGIVSGVLSARAAASTAEAPPLMRIAPLAGVLLYAVILAVAIAPSLATGLDIRPLQVESVCVTLLLLLGIAIAWIVIVRPESTGTHASR